MYICLLVISHTMSDFFKEINIDNGFSLIKANNFSEKKIHLKTKRKDLYIQFHFVLEGQVCFHIIKGTHKLPVAEQESLMFFNPKNIIPIDAFLISNTKMLSVLLSLSAIHKLLDDFAIDFSFLKPKIKDKKLYSKKQLSANELIIINQIYNRDLKHKLDYIYIKAKILELFTYYFSQNQPIKETCYNLKDERILEKIKKAKEILVANINEPPSIEELSNQVLLPVGILKKGFKELYGEPVYKYILNYKLELGRHLLMSKKYSVKEVSYQMGYSAPTHFVVAFKKKFGITPKKYVQNL